MKLAAAAIVWLVFVMGGMYALLAYKSTPGVEAAAPPEWPTGSKLQRIPGSATLIMMSHPHCPCTRASLAELQMLLGQYHGKLTAYVLFIRPEGVDFEWTNTDLWRTASHIEGARVVIDDGSTESDRFKGLTSGHVVLYDAAGRLAFSGGITGGRGHIGDNLGLQRILAVLHGEQPDRTDSPVFGCPLHAEY